MPADVALTERMQTWFLVHDRLCTFCRAVDAKAFDGLRQVFAADALGIYDGQPSHDSCDELIAKMEEHVGAASRCGASQHNILNLQVDLVDGGVRSRAYFYAVQQGALDYAGRFWKTWGEYDDRWILTDAGWRVVERRYTTFCDEGPREIVGRTSS